MGMRFYPGAPVPDDELAIALQVDRTVIQAEHAAAALDLALGEIPSGAAGGSDPDAGYAFYAFLHRELPMIARVRAFRTFGWGKGPAAAYTLVTPDGGPECGRTEDPAAVEALIRLLGLAERPEEAALARRYGVAWG